MIYRRFGRTGLDVPVLSAGFMRAMHSWQAVPDKEIPKENQRNFTDIVRTALELGINHFESANAYGTSEQQLGSSLRDISRDSFLLQTKVQPAANPQQFIKDFYVSLARLQVERVDLLAIHGINDYQALWQVCRENGCLAAARNLQKEGKVGAIGFSGHGPPEVIREALNHRSDSGFDYVNIHWYYIYQVNTGVLQDAAERDMGVFIISPTDKGGMLQKPPEKFRLLCSPLEPMMFNDVFCLAHPGVQTLSVGASRPEDFTAHVASLEYLESLDTVGEIDRKCQQEMARTSGFSRPEALWAKLPSWDRTPGLINIPFILWLFNLARGWGLMDYSRERYRRLGEEVKWVPGNNGSHARRHEMGSIAEGAGLSADELYALLEEAHQLLGDESHGETYEDGCPECITGKGT